MSSKLLPSSRTTSCKKHWKDVTTRKLFQKEKICLLFALNEVHLFIFFFFHMKMVRVGSVTKEISSSNSALSQIR